LAAVGWQDDKLKQQLNPLPENRRWLAIWVLAVLFLLGSLLGYEWLLKTRGFKPSVEVTQDLWSWNRSRASQDNALVLVGASRIQLAIDIETLREQWPDKHIASLAVNGSFPMSTLIDLAADEEFNGLVLLSFHARMLEPDYFDMQKPYVDHYHNSAGYLDMMNARVMAWLQSKWRLLHPLMNLHDLLHFFIENRRFPDPPYISFHPDTTASADYQISDVNALRHYFLQSKQRDYQQHKAMNDDVWVDGVQRMMLAIRAIEQRGGQVIVLRFPVGPAHWLLDQAEYPRARYWDVMLLRNPDLKALHFLEHPGWQAFDFPDSSHLDASDKVAFTEQLLSTILLHWPELH